MSDIFEQIEKIEQEIRETPYHKGTEHHIGKLRARLAKLKDQVMEQQARSSGGGGGYAIKKQGNATVVLAGPPSVGKSTLINRLTNAQSRVAAYAFTTVSVIPGMMKYKDAYIQILDVPGLIEGAEEGRGRGREVLSVIRGADLVLIVSDVEKIRLAKNVFESLERNGIRLNKRPPDVKIDKKLTGGIKIFSNIKQTFSLDFIKQVAQEYGIKNAEIIINEPITLESLIDSFSKNRVYVPCILVINKIDVLDKRRLNEIEQETKNLLPGIDSVMISAENKINLERLREMIWDKLGLIRIYLIKPDQPVDSLDNPFIAKKGDTLEDIAKRIGEGFAKNKKRARIWGGDAKFPGQEVSLSKLVSEGMKISFL